MRGSAWSPEDWKHSSLRREKLNSDYITERCVLAWASTCPRWSDPEDYFLLWFCIKQPIGYQFSFSCALTLARNCHWILISSNTNTMNYCIDFSHLSMANIRDSGCHSAAVLDTKLWSCDRKALFQGAFFWGLTSLSGIFVSFLPTFTEFC